MTMIPILEEASKANDCLDWLHNCKAECCKTMYFRVGKKLKPRVGAWLTIKLKDEESADLQKYMTLHGGFVTGNVVRFRLARFDYDKKAGLIKIHRKCDWLTDELLCKGHPDKKPAVCKRLTLDYARGRCDGIKLTPKCLFKYKLALEDS